MRPALRSLRLTTPLGSLCLAALGLAGCASTPDEAQPSSLDDTAFNVAGGVTMERLVDGPIGEFLTHVSGQIQAWSNYQLSVSKKDVPRRRAVENDLQRLTRTREEELVHELQTGAPRNRAISAAALGFTRSETALGPLLAAVDDADGEVQRNALFALGVLADPDTILDPVLEQVTDAVSEKTRLNASYAVMQVLGSRELDTRLNTEERHLEALRSALFDPEPGVRVHAAKAIQLTGDVESLEILGDLLEDDAALVCRAAAQAIRGVGEKRDEHYFDAAQLLFESWQESKGTKKSLLYQEMALLAGQAWSDKELDRWRAWAYSSNR